MLGLESLSPAKFNIKHLLARTARHWRGILFLTHLTITLTFVPVGRIVISASRNPITGLTILPWIEMQTRHDFPTAFGLDILMKLPTSRARQKKMSIKLKRKAARIYYSLEGRGLRKIRWRKSAGGRFQGCLMAGVTFNRLQQLGRPFEFPRQWDNNRSGI